MAFNIKKCKVLRIGQEKPIYEYNMLSQGIEEMQVERDLGSWSHPI